MAVPDTANFEVFISYNRKDTDFVRELNTALGSALARQDRRVWVDWSAIPKLSGNFWADIQTGILAANSFCFVLSPDYIASPYCIGELIHAMRNNKRLIPILIRMIDAGALDEAVRRHADFGGFVQSLPERERQPTLDKPVSLHNWLRFDNCPFPQAFEDMLNALNEDLDWKCEQTYVLTHANEWIKNNRDRSYLLQGSSLRRAEMWRDETTRSNKGKLTPEQIEYLSAGRQAALHAQHIRFSLMGAGLVLAGMLTLFSLFMAEIAHTAATAAQSAQAKAEIADKQDSQEAQIERQARDQARADEETERKAKRAADAEAARERQAEIAEMKEAHREQLAENEARTERQAALIARDSARNQARQVRLAYDQLKLATAKANRMTYRSLLGMAQQAAQMQPTQIGSVREILRSIPTSTPHAFEWGYLYRLSHRELLTLQGHTGRVIAVAVSHNGQRVATAGLDNTVRIWNADTAEQIASIPTPEGDPQVEAVAFSPDDRWIVTGEHTWEVATGRPLSTLNPPLATVDPDGTRITPTSVGVSPDGLHIVTGYRHIVRKSGSNNFRPSVALVWEANTGKLITTLGPQKSLILAVAFSPDSSLIATGGQNSPPMLWNATTGRLMQSLAGDYGAVRALAFARNGDLVTGHPMGTFAVWKQNRDYNAHFVEESSESAVTGVACAPTRDLIAVNYSDNLLRIWETNNTAPTGGVPRPAATAYHLLRQIPGAAGPVAFFPDSHRIVTGADDNTAKIWDVDAPPFNPIHTTAIGARAVSPDGTRLASYAPKLGYVVITGIDTGRRLGTIPTRADAIAYGPHGDILATLYGGQIRFWNPTTGQPLSAASTAPPLPILAQVTGGDMNQGWQPALVFAPDAKRIAWTAADGVIVRELQRGTELRLKAPGVTAIALSRNPLRIVTGQRNGNVTLWDEQGRVLRHIAVHGAITALGFLPDGRVAVGAQGQTPILWDSQTGNRLATTLPAQENDPFTVTCLIVSTDGTRLLTGDNHNTLRIWDTATGLELLTLPPAERATTTQQPDRTAMTLLALSPDNTRVVTGSDDHRVHLLEAAFPDPAKPLRTMAHR